MFLPDVRGQFPIDIAGLRGKKEIVEFLAQAYRLLKFNSLALEKDISSKSGQ